MIWGIILKQQNIDILSDFITYSQVLQTDLMIARYEGCIIKNINMITDEEQNKLDEALEILKTASKRIQNSMFGK